MQEYSQEIKGCAGFMGLPYGWITVMNIAYELTDFCTSIVAQTNDGKILHARNLDFGIGSGFTDILKNLTFRVDVFQGGKVKYRMTSFAGFVGALTGQRPGQWSFSINTRWNGKGFVGLFYEIVAAIQEKNATLVSFLARDALNEAHDYATALNMLSNTELISHCYYTIGGLNPGEGAVVSRDPTKPADVWKLDVSQGRWWLLQTNYDHWKPDPWFDDRRDPGNHNMEKMGRDGLSLDGLYHVLSQKPTLNLQTTYSALSYPGNGTYLNYVRWCHYPCVE